MGKRKQRSDVESAAPDSRGTKRAQALPVQTTPALRPVTRSVKAHATRVSRNAVLDTTELLENILTQLPLRSLFQMQPVSRHFKNVIEKSPTIQKLLRPNLEPSNKRWVVRGSMLTGTDSASRGLSLFVALCESGNTELRVLLLNEDVFRPQAKKHLLMAARAGGETVSFRERRMEQGLLHYMRGRKHSYEDLYVTQPHCTRLAVTCEISIGAEAALRGRHIDVQRTREITVRDIFESVLGMQRRGPYRTNNDWIEIEERGKITNQKIWAGMEDKPLRQPISETIRQLEEVYGKEAKVIQFSIFFKGVVTPSLEEIIDVESHPGFRRE